MNSRITSQRRIAFEANNVGIALLRHGHYTQSIAAFRNSLHMLDLSNKSDSAMLLEESHTVKINLLVPPGSPSSVPGVTSSVKFVHSIELGELSSMHKLPNDDGAAYAITLRELPEETNENLDLQTSSVMYNYALCYILAYFDQKFGDAASGKHRLLEGARKLLFFARRVAFKAIGCEQEKEGMASLTSLHLADFILSQLTTVCELQSDDYSRQGVRVARGRLEELLCEALVFEDTYQITAARAA